MKKATFFDKLNVSRETIESLQKYVKLLTLWNNRINLVSKNTVRDAWDRHVLDSAQLMSFLDNNAKKWIDLGTGAGFPGLVVAAIAKERSPHLSVSLVESDKRKCVFLNQAAEILEVNVEIYPERIEECLFLNADIVSARALAPIKQLLPYLAQIGNKRSKGLFLKGKNVYKELDDVKNISEFNIKISPSVVDVSGFVLEIEKRKGFSFE